MNGRRFTAITLVAALTTIGCARLPSSWTDAYQPNLVSHAPVTAPMGPYEAVQQGAAVNQSAPTGASWFACIWQTDVPDPAKPLIVTPQLSTNLALPGGGWFDATNPLTYTRSMIVTTQIPINVNRGFERMKVKQ